MVIVILGILAASAIPKFTDLSTQAEQAATDGVAGAAGAAFAVNVAVCAASTGLTNCTTPITNCTDATTVLQGGLPSGYTVASQVITSGGSASCTVTRTASSTTASFTGLAP